MRRGPVSCAHSGREGIAGRGSPLSQCLVWRDDSPAVSLNEKCRRGDAVTMTGNLEVTPLDDRESVPGWGTARRSGSMGLFGELHRAACNESPAHSLTVSAPRSCAEPCDAVQRELPSSPHSARPFGGADAARRRKGPKRGQSDSWEPPTARATETTSPTLSSADTASANCPLGKC
jgi:hypothetical protein